MRLIMIDTMPINAIKLENYPPFRSQTISFGPGVNVVTGRNGIGKSRLLAALRLRHDYSGEQRFSTDETWPDDTPMNAVVNTPAGPVAKWRLDVFGELAALNSAPSIRILSQRLHGQEFNTQPFSDWLINTRHYASNSKNLPQRSERALEFALMVFSLLDRKISFHGLDDDHTPVLKTPNGLVPLNAMSSGYQSAHGLLLNLVKILDARLIHPDAEIRDFEGVLLIDEIETHLHPTWQRQIVNILAENFPRAQMIVSTHSPHVIQGLKADQIIPLDQDDEALTFVKEIRPVPGSFGLQGWSIEEILRDVMGNEDTLSIERQRAETAFNDALDNEDLTAAQEPYETLMAMLHPENVLRRIYDHQYRAAGGTPKEHRQA
jgi:hypothetical protein